VRWALISAVVLEILDELLRVVAEVSEIYCASARFEEKELVEMFEKDSARLMDRAEDGLSSVGKL
jgi:uncharacterized membrane protein